MTEKTLTGYASVTYQGTPDTEYELAPGVKERVAPGAFDRTLREHPDVFALLSHDSGRPIGRTTSEPASLYLSTDKRGLLASILPVDTTDGADAVALVESRTLRGMSFAFQCVQDEWNPGPNGSAIRDLIDVELVEVSCVAWPAYKGTSLAISPASRALTHKLGSYSRRVQSLTFEPRTQIHKGPRMIERADERRDASQLLTQSKLRLREKRSKLLEEREAICRMTSAEARERENEIAGELIDLLRQERNLAQCEAR
jgi:hypothetical protein